MKWYDKINVEYEKRIGKIFDSGWFVVFVGIVMFALGWFAAKDKDTQQLMHFHFEHELSIKQTSTPPSVPDN